jgi:hypothetical protein
MRRAELARITHWSKNTWLINYKLWAACGCYYDRFVLQVQGEPTLEEALKLIDEDKTKR